MRVNPGIYLFACCSATFSAAAQAPQPSAEFWQYLLEFGGEKGELLDPLEFAQVNGAQLHKMSRTERGEDVSGSIAQTPSQSPAQTHTSSSRNPRTSSSAEESSP